MSVALKISQKIHHFCHYICTEELTAMKKKQPSRQPPSLFQQDPPPTTNSCLSTGLCKHITFLKLVISIGGRLRNIGRERDATKTIRHLSSAATERLETERLKGSRSRDKGEDFTVFSWGWIKILNTCTKMNRTCRQNPSSKLWPLTSNSPPSINQSEYKVNKNV